MTWARWWRAFDQARVVPRAVLLGYAAMVWRATEWFEALKDPNNAQGAFIAVVYGAIPLLLNFYMQNGTKWDAGTTTTATSATATTTRTTEGEGK